MGIIFIPALGLWFAFSIVIAMWARRKTGRVLPMLVAFAVTFLLPAADTLVGLVIAKYYQSMHGSLIPDAPIIVRGFQSDEWDASFLPPETSFEYVEQHIEYVPIPGIREGIGGPGFYQFRSVSARKEYCQPGFSAEQIGIFGFGGRCFRYSYSAEPVSRYKFVAGGWERVLLNVQTYCVRVFDRLNKVDVARSCKLQIFTWGEIPLIDLEMPPAFTWWSDVLVSARSSDAPHEIKGG